MPTLFDPQEPRPAGGLTPGPEGPSQVVKIATGPISAAPVKLIPPSSYIVLAATGINGANFGPAIASRDLIRGDDLLVLHAALYANSNNQVFVEFTFPAQHIVETAAPALSVFDGMTPPANQTPFQVSAGPFGWTGSAGVTGSILPNPALAVDSPGPDPFSSPLTLGWLDLRLPGTGLLFLIPDLIPSNPDLATFLQQPLSTLLDWSEWQLCVAPNAPSAAFFGSHATASPAAPATQAEVIGSTLAMVFGMVFTPTELGAWTHLDAPKQGATGRVELWHTRLVPQPAAGSVSPTMRAAWSLTQALKSTAPSSLSAYPMAPNAPQGNPHQIPVVPATNPPSTTPTPTPLLYDGLTTPASGTWTGEGPDPRTLPYAFQYLPDSYVPQPSTALTGNDLMQDLVTYTTYTSPAVPGVELPAEDVLLSALGGSLETGFDFATGSGHVPLNSLLSFQHQQHLGRDLSANSLSTSIIAPFGHPAILGQAFQRAIDPAHPFAVIEQKNTLRIQNRTVQMPPLIDFVQPFRSITLTTKSFPVFSAPDASGFYYPVDNNGNIDGPKIMVSYEAIDAAGSPITFDLPLQLVSLGRPPVISAPLQLNQQRVAYSTGSNSIFETISLTLTLASAPFGWQVKEAVVSHPAISHFAGTASITLTPNLAKQSADTLACIQSSASVDGSQHTDKYGAFAAPVFGLNVLSKQYGAVGGSIPDSGTASTESLSALVASLFGSTTLLGVFSMSDLVTSLIDAAVPGADKQVPSITSVNNAGTVTVTMSYDSTSANAALVTNLPATSTTGPWLATLTIGSINFTSSAVHGASGVATSGSCTLNNPTIQLPGGSDQLVSFAFNSMHFTSSSDAKATASVDFNQVQFHNDLSFVNSIIDILPSSLFSNPPEITITDTECVVDCGVDFPSIGIGIFSLSNINLDANLTIPFVASPALEDPSTANQMTFVFNFSTVDDPFTLSVLGFAGSGSFGVTISSSAIVVNGSLAFGGQYAIDVIVASGYVSLEAGVHIVYTSSPTGQAPADVDVGGFVHLSGGVEVLDLVSLALDAMLQLAYDSASDSFTGSAEITLTVDIAFFHKSVSFTVSKTFSGSSSSTSQEILEHAASGGLPVRNPFLPAPNFLSVMDQAHWNDYCGAFAS